MNGRESSVLRGYLDGEAMDHDHETVMFNGYPVRGMGHYGFVINPSPKTHPEMFTKKGKENWERDHPDHPHNEHPVHPDGTKCRAEDPATCRYLKSHLYGTSEGEARLCGGVFDPKHVNTPTPQGTERDKILRKYGLGSEASRIAANAKLVRSAQDEAIRKYIAMCE